MSAALLLFLTVGGAANEVSTSCSETVYTVHELHMVMLYAPHTIDITGCTYNEGYELFLYKTPSPAEVLSVRPLHHHSEFAAPKYQLNARGGSLHQELDDGIAALPTGGGHHQQHSCCVVW